MDRMTVERRHTMTDEWAPFASVCGISLLLVLLVSTSPEIVVVVVVVVMMDAIDGQMA